MPSANKRRGNQAENYIVERAVEHGINAERFWGSDGRSAGYEHQDDGIIGWYRWQSKRFKWKNVVKWFLENAVKYLHDEQDIVTFYIDRAPGHPRTVYVVQELESWLELKRMATLYGKQKGGCDD